MKLSPKYNLAILYPSLAEQWNHEKNDRQGPEKFTPGSRKKVWWKCKDGHEWEARISHRIKNAGCPYCSRENSSYDNNLAFLYPHIAKEWNYDRNANLKPEDFTPGSGKKVWWKCADGHEWSARIRHRINDSGCPFCSGSIASHDNNLSFLYPDIAKEWNYDRNDDLTPEDVTPGSDKEVWWKCKDGHEWEARISQRINDAGCPYCSSENTSHDYNLASLFPEIAREWNYDRNANLKPEDFMPGSGKKVWWKCKDGHEWEARISNRISDVGCPCCSGSKVSPENNFAVLHPDMAKEWNYSRNGSFNPEDFKPRSNKKVWWKCGHGHEWKSSIAHRIEGDRCPFCSKNTR